MKSIWTARYEGNEIRIENTWFNGERLYVNGDLQDERYSVISSRLTGHLVNQNKESKMIKVTLGGAFKVNCILFIDDKKIEVVQEK